MREYALLRNMRIAVKSLLRRSRAIAILDVVQEEECRESD